MTTYVSLLHVLAHKKALLREGHTKTYTKEGTIIMKQASFLTNILNIPFERYRGVQCPLQKFQFSRILNVCTLKCKHKSYNDNIR